MTHNSEKYRKTSYSGIIQAPQIKFKLLFFEIMGIISPIGLGLKFYAEWLSFSVKTVYFDEKSNCDVIPRKKSSEVRPNYARYG